VADGRLRVVPRDDLVDVAVAILTTCGDFAGDGGLGMNAMRITLAFAGVALAAGDLLRWRVVRKALDVGVAIDTGEHGAVNGVLELVLIDGDAVAVARGHARVAVAGEAVRVFELLRGVCGRGRGKQEKNERTNKKPTRSVHTSRRRFGRVSCRDRCHNSACRYQLSAFS
jgi:hypothetical protein